MEAPTTTTIEMASGDLNLQSATLKAGDRFDADHFMRRGDIDERILGQLRTQGRVQPLSRDAYRAFLNRYGEDFVGRGFTRAFLIEHGIIDEAAPRATPKPKTIPKPPTENAEVIEYKGRKIVAKKNGRFTLFDVTSADGELLRATPFKKIEGAKGFIDDLPSGSTPPPPADTTAGDKQESENGGDVQRGSIGSDQQDAVPAGGHEHRES